MSTSVRVGIQGARAAFHEVAAVKHFGEENLEVIECETFRELCDQLASNQCDYCVMAIENTIAGSILTNYNLLERYRFKIVGEVYLRIKMNLMALPGQKIEDLKFINSHPMALSQCEEFFSQKPHLQLIESVDTAQSAREIKEKGLKDHGAVASSLAAKMYGLEILNEGIETHKLNYTRFLIISKNDMALEKGDKASIRFETAHKAGCLVAVLQVLDEHKINLTKLQSVPIVGKPYLYAFHADLEWKEKGQYEKAMVALLDVTEKLVHFGVYPRSHRDMK